MKTEDIVKQIEELPNGRFFRMKYLTKLPVKAEFANEGTVIMKIVETTCRTGVAYGKIKSVIVKLSGKGREDSAKTNNWEWTVHNKIKFNNQTKKSYFVVAPIKKGANTTKTYILSQRDVVRIVGEDEIKDYVRDSYWTEKEHPAVMNITLENILTIWN